MSVVLDLFGGFWTWQTPVSFLAGVGAYHFYYRLSRKIVIYKVEDKED